MAKRQQQDPSLRPYAVIGAEQRLLQIADEARAIFQVFPELRAPNRGFEARGGESPFSWQKHAAEEGGLVGNGRRRKGEETETQDVGGGAEEDQRRSAGAVGEAEGGRSEREDAPAA